MERRWKDVLWLAIFGVMAECQFDQLSFEPYNPGVNSFDEGAFSDSSLFKYVKPNSSDDDIPIIIWWTGRLFLGDGLKLLQCPDSVCYSTSDRSLVNDPRTRGFYFYGTDLDPEDMPLPRKPHHEWALYHEESPMNNYMLVHNAMLKLFNHTSTFRRESDYPLSSNSIISLEYLTERKPVPVVEKNKARKRGFAPIVYLQSHCDVASDRDRFVKELMEYIEIDSYGQCVHNKDIPEELQDPVETMDSPALYDLISKYKFHLAYENAICKDYMTEKLFRPLHVGSIPVYKGSDKAKDWMPDNKSVILIDDFSSAEELAKFLKHLDENDSEYESYLSYKQNGINNTYLINNIRNREWGQNEPGKPDSLVGFECYVCRQLTLRHQRESLQESYPYISPWPHRMANGSHLNCPQPYPSVGEIQDLPDDDTWLRQMWVEDYWTGLDKAEALTEMLKNNEDDPSSFMEYLKKMPFTKPLL